MSKTILAAAIAEKTGLNKAQASEAVDTVINTITESLQKGEKFTIPGFLAFDVVSKKASTGRNPSTGATIEIPARNAVRVKVGATLKKAAPAV